MKSNWNDLAAEEKREKRFARWLSAEGRKFNSPEAEQKYKDIVTRLIKVIKLEEPDRVPVMLPTGTVPIYMAGLTYKEAMYDSEKLCKAYTEAFHIFKGDDFAAPMVRSAKAHEIIKTKTSKYPGHGLSDDGHGFQFIEGEYMMPLMKFRQMAMAEGYPSLMGAFAHAPFDLMGDTLRGTHGIIMDMYRQPGKLKQAMEKLVPLNIEIAVGAANRTGCPIAVFPLHKGDDTMMSTEQYKEFYWPTFRKVIMGLIDEGVVPLLFAEGRYNDRFEIIKDLPRAGAIWYFDRTDMVRAKEILGDTACLMGNVPTALLCTGTPQEVKEYCRKLIEVVGKGGGYILAGGASLEKGNPDNIHVMSDAAFEYGVYTK